MTGFAFGYRAMEGADALLVLGSDFPYPPQFYPASATSIQVDIRGEQLGRWHPLGLGLVGEVAPPPRPCCRGWARGGSAPTCRTRPDRPLQEEAGELDELAVPARGVAPIHPQYLRACLTRPPRTTSCSPPTRRLPDRLAARYLNMNGRRRLIGSFSHGSMANALLHGIGAQAAETERQVVALAGDGGLTDDARRADHHPDAEQPSGETIVVNNSSLNFVELEMKAAGFVNCGTGLVNPDFAAVSQAMGIFVRRVERSEDLPAALREVLAHDGPALLDVVTERQELSMPPNATAEQVKGFALYAIRTVLSGRGDELLDLAKANWRQLF